MKMREIRAAVLQALYSCYERGGLTVATTAQSVGVGLPGVAVATLRDVLYEFKNDRIVAFIDTSGGIKNLRLTPRGVEAVEDPATEFGALVQNINVSGGNVQIGNGNQQTINLQVVLSAAAALVEKAPGFSDNARNQWSSTLRAIAQQPGAQQPIHPVLSAAQANKQAATASLLCVALDEERLLELGPGWTRLDSPPLIGAVLYRHDARMAADVAWLDAQPVRQDDELE